MAPCGDKIAEASQDQVELCTLTFLVAPTDLAHWEITLQHILRMCAVQFQQVIVVIDDLPVADSSRAAELVSLLLSAERLLKHGIISRYITLSSISTESLGLSYLGTTRVEPRDHRHVPMFGWIAGIAASKTDWLLHFDSDILLFQQAGHSWIKEGMQRMQEDDNLLFVSPLPGPPTQDGSLPGQPVLPRLDANNNIRLKTFSSRVFLTSRSRLQNILPTHLIRDTIPGVPGLYPWEMAVSVALSQSHYDRAHLSSHHAWFLHCPDHGAEWQEALADIVKRIELNHFPNDQRGYYDLILSAWTE